MEKQDHDYNLSYCCECDKMVYLCEHAKPTGRFLRVDEIVTQEMRDALVAAFSRFG